MSAERFRVFTLIELMIVVAIIGILAAIAIPAYTNYIARAQATEGVELMAGAKTPLAQYFADHKRWPDSLDKIAEQTSGKYTRSIAISKGAGGTGPLELTATMHSEKVDRRVAGHTIRLSSNDGGKSWICRAGTMPADNLPASCRD